MRGFLVLAVALSVAPVARADETDDALARRMVSVVSDFRQPLSARVEAARTIAKLGARASVAVPDLVNVLDRLRGAELELLQEAVVEALGQIGAAARVALPSFAKATARTTDIDQAIKHSTKLILNSPDSLALEMLSQQLQSRDAGTRLRAAKSLADLGTGAQSATPALVAALGDTDPDVRRAVVAALQRIDPNAPPSEALISAIAADLKNPDPNYRLVAARALANIGPPAAFVAPDLIALRTDRDPDVRRAAAAAFARVTAPAP